MSKQKIIRTISILIENQELNRLNNNHIITNEQLAEEIFNLFDMLLGLTPEIISNGQYYDDGDL